MQQNINTKWRDRSRENKDTGQPISAGGAQYAINDRRKAICVAKGRVTGYSCGGTAIDLMHKKKTRTNAHQSQAASTMHPNAGQKTNESSMAVGRAQ